MHNRDQILRKLKALKADPSVVGELYFFLKKDENYQVKMGDLDAEAQEELSTGYLDAIIEYFEEETLAVRNLTNADSRDNVLYFYDYEEKIPEFDIIKSVQIDAAIDEYKFKSTDINVIKGYIISYVSEKIRISFYKEHYSIMLVKKDKGNTLAKKMSVRLTAANRITELKEDIFRLSYNFDFLFISEEVYIKDIKKLESRFSFLEILKKKAKDSIKEIENIGIVHDITGLYKCAEKPSFARKLVKISNRSAVLKKCNKEDVIQFITTYDSGSLADQLRINPESKKLELKNEKSRKAFLNILDDSYLNSQLTEANYLSIAKDGMSEN